MENIGSARILVVDDEDDICEIIRFNLEAEGYSVDTVNSAEKALNRNLEDYDLFLLDVMMKGISGFVLADEITKKRKLKKSIIFITAKNSENDKLTGFSVGADDFITKPFSVKELTARVRAVLRRGESAGDKQKQRLSFEELELDLEKKRLYIDGKKTDVTPNEYKILKLLLRSPGVTFTRDEILDYAWKDVTVVERTIDVHITRLRKKLGKYGKYLISRSGYGYCLEKETEEP
jgi:two-component system, OmpR family, alkaline phosphatase synthesis response regulator PhoP